MSSTYDISHSMKFVKAGSNINCFCLQTIVRISIYYVRPETILFLQIWPKDAKRLDTSALQGETKRLSSAWCK